jgi:hypothetical protein
VTAQAAHRGRCAANNRAFREIGSRGENRTQRCFPEDFQHYNKGDNIMLKLHRAIKLMVCLVVIASFLGCASTRTQRATGEYVDDSVVTTKVKAAIFEEPTLKTMQIEVKTFKGEVQLSGFVDSAQSVAKAGEVARSVKGVIKVNNDLIVK